MIPFMCLVIPWKISSPVGFWSSSPAEYTYENMVIANQKANDNGTNVKNPNTDAEANTGMNVSANENDHINMKVNTGSGEDTTKNKSKQIITIAMILWGIVAAVLYLYSIIAYGKLKKQLCTCIKIRKNVFIADDIPVQWR